MDVIGGAGLGDVLLSRINITIMPSKCVLRGAGRALRYRLVGESMERWLGAVYGAVRGRCPYGCPQLAFANRPRMQADIGIGPQCFGFSCTQMSEEFEQ